MSLIAQSSTMPVAKNVLEVSVSLLLGTQLILTSSLHKSNILALSSRLPFLTAI